MNKSLNKCTWKADTHVWDIPLAILPPPPGKAAPPLHMVTATLGV